MKYLVLGAGMMGSAAAYDLARSGADNQVVLADINLQTAKRSAGAIGPNVEAVRLDVNSNRDLVGAMKGCNAVISAVTYSVNLHVTRAALEAGVHVCDLGGNNDVVAKQLSLDGEARARGVTVIPNSGLAPGLINILAVTASKGFDTLDSISLRVGGLPRHPRPPLNYQIVFSVEGLINEYVEQALVIQDGELKHVDPMSGLEEIEFPAPFGTLEAFTTSGGLSTLPELFAGRVKTLDYKTIRYRGHCEKFKTLLDLGFATMEPMMVGGSVKTNREFFADLLRKKLDFGDKDVVLARATITGTRDGARKVQSYEFVDHYDESASITAMMRATAFPTSITAQMLAHGTIAGRGVKPPELCVPGDAMIDELAKRNLRITKSITETWS
ncbi:MAG TPA: saccharopine dehydrogenase C-terminal domain-containing protein [Bacteroidota bacterium]|nr:saccharopine dehydrogenase C-terminal domain-containing protein [Bacteroidota bacterium]